MITILLCLLYCGSGLYWGYFYGKIVGARRQRIWENTVNNRLPYDYDEYMRKMKEQLRRKDEMEK